MNDLGEAILSHYEDYLGDFIGADPYSNDDKTIQLLGFDKAVKDCLVFATLGLSNYSDDIDNCCEILMASDDDYDNCAEVFMNSVFYVLSNHMKFGRGILIEGADSIVEDFSTKHNKSAVYFTNVYVLPNDFSSIGDDCNFYMGFFVSKQEAEYIKQYGCEKFEDILEQKNIDVIDLNRPSAI